MNFLALCKSLYAECNDRFITASLKPFSNRLQIYCTLINKIQEQPTCIKSWDLNYDVEFSHKQWQVIFTLPSILTQYNIMKLREFQ